VIGQSHYRPDPIFYPGKVTLAAGPQPWGDGGQLELRPGPPDVYRQKRVYGRVEFARNPIQLSKGGRLDPSLVRRILVRHRRRIQDCYERELRRDAALAGRARVRLTIGPEGTVAAVTMISNGTGDERVGDCVLDHMRQARFPPTGGDSESFRVVIRLRRPPKTGRAAPRGEGLGTGRRLR